jgi:hypothetical protein
MTFVISAGIGWVPLGVLDPQPASATAVIARQMRFHRFIECKVIAFLRGGVGANVHQVSESMPEAVRHHRANGSGLHQSIVRLPSRQPAMLYSCGTPTTTSHNHLERRTPP